MHEKTGSETEKSHSKIENVISEMRVDNIAVKMGSFFSLDFSIDIISLSIKFIWHKKIVCNNTETLITYSIKIRFYGFINIVEIQVYNEIVLLQVSVSF